jgi:predicted oxidoreductase (fatty acid repression mutant protein)
MNERDLSHNLLMAHMCIKSANECLKTIYEFRDKIDNKEFIEVIKQVKPKLSFFNNAVDRALLASPEFKSKHWEELEEECYQILEKLNEEIKQL